MPRLKPTRERLTPIDAIAELMIAVVGQATADALGEQLSYFRPCDSKLLRADAKLFLDELKDLAYDMGDDAFAAMFFLIQYREKTEAVNGSLLKETVPRVVVFRPPWYVLKGMEMGSTDGYRRQCKGQFQWMHDAYKVLKPCERKEYWRLRGQLIALGESLPEPPEQNVEDLPLFAQQAQ